jgi:hypothetical protein
VPISRTHSVEAKDQAKRYTDRMKVRWTRSSLRLRITPDELAALERGEAVEERMGIPGGFVMRLEPADVTALDSSEGSVRFALSSADLGRLCAPDVEGVYFQDGFRYFVEKDFPCAHPRAAEALEPKAGTFERPVEPRM